MHQAMHTRKTVSISLILLIKSFPQNFHITVIKIAVIPKKAGFNYKLVSYTAR